MKRRSVLLEAQQKSERVNRAENLPGQHPGKAGPADADFPSPPGVKKKEEPAALSPQQGAEPVEESQALSAPLEPGETAGKAAAEQVEQVEVEQLAAEQPVAAGAEPAKAAQIEVVQAAAGFASALAAQPAQALAR